MKSIYNLTQAAVELATALEDGELTEELENALVINQSELQEKAINYGYVIRELSGTVGLIDQEIKRLQALKKAKKNAIDRLKESVKNAMMVYFIDKVKSPLMKISLRRSESVEVDFQEQMDERFLVRKETVKPNKVAIKEAIKSGVNVEGARIQEKYSIQIR